MAEFGAREGSMTQDESEQIAALAQEIDSGHYPTLTLELLRRLNTQLKARKNQEPALVIFGRFLFGEKIARFPEDVIAWRTERDYLSLTVDQLSEALARKNGRLADFRMRHRLDEENYKTEVLRLTRVITGLEDRLRVLTAVRDERNALSDEVIGWKREATDAKAENQALAAEITTLNKAVKELGLQVNAAKNDLLDIRRENETLDAKLDFSQACALSYENQLQGRTAELNTARASIDNLRRDVSRITEELDTAKGYVQNLRQDNSRVVGERNDWRRAKQESDDVIKQLVALVPREVKDEDIFQAIKRLVSERQRIGTNLIDIRQSVESFLQQFGSWVEPNGTRHCNEEHVGHGLCKALDDVV